jgi:hypothetical protein
MDQQSVESLLRRLVQRVEESERHYSEALNKLHARIDQLSRTTDAARAAGSPADAGTFDRLHDQVSNLAQRLEPESATPLDDFERLGRALSGELGYGTGPAAAPASGDFPSAPLFASSVASYSYPLPQPDFSPPSLASSFPDDDRNLDKRLVEMAHRLEHSIGTAVPAQTIEALNARLDEIGHQIAQALEHAPKRQALEAVEQKISDVAQQLGEAQTKFARIGEIEAALNGLIERVDGSAAQLENVAKKAASEAAQRVAEQAKLSAGTAERLDAMHRDLMAMSDGTRESDERLAATIEAVHESLKKLVLLVEQSASQPQMPKPRVPFAERMRQLDPPPPAAETKPETAPPAKNGNNAGETAEPARGSAFKNRLRAAIPDFQEHEPAPRFGRAKTGRAEEKSHDLDPDDSARAIAKGAIEDADFDTPEKLVAAARRAAQAAALKAEARAARSRVRRLPGDAEASMASEQPSRRKRSLLIICAAVLLAISALLLYGRLRSKPEAEIVAAPATEQSAPAPATPEEGRAAPGRQDPASDAMDPNSGAPAEPRSGSFEVRPAPEASPAADAVGAAEQPGNVTEVAKSSCRPASADQAQPPLQPASLVPTAAPQLPPGVVFAIEDPSAAKQQQTMTGTPAPIPRSSSSSG